MTIVKIASDNTISKFYNGTFDAFQHVANLRHLKNNAKQYKQFFKYSMFIVDLRNIKL